MTCRRALQTHPKSSFRTLAAHSRRPHFEVAAQREGGHRWGLPGRHRGAASTAAPCSTGTASFRTSRTALDGSPVSCAGRFRKTAGVRPDHRPTERGRRPCGSWRCTGLARSVWRARCPHSLSAREGQELRTETRGLANAGRRGRAGVWHQAFRHLGSKEAALQRSHLSTPATHQSRRHRALPESRRPSAWALGLGERVQLRPVETAGLASQGGRP